MQLRSPLTEAKMTEGFKGRCEPKTHRSMEINKTGEDYGKADSLRRPTGHLLGELSDLMLETSEMLLCKAKVINLMYSAVKLKILSLLL